MENTVDLEARKAASQAFRDFVSGKISNFEFEDSEPDTNDRAIHAIWNTAWVYYDDFKKHKLDGNHRLRPDDRRACVRWILFLQNNLPYEWPDLFLPGIDPASRIQNNFLVRLFSVSASLSEEKARRFLSAGHYPVWPFARVSDYKEALAKPRLLTGSSV